MNIGKPEEVVEVETPAVPYEGEEIPEEVKQAQRVNQERDRIIAQAKEEAGRIVELARRDATGLTEGHPITKQAQELAL